MSGVPVADQGHGADGPARERPITERPVTEQPIDKPPSPAADKRSRWETILAPIGLAVLGLAMILAAVKVYPRTSEPPAPAFSFLEVDAAFRIFSIGYSVIGKSSTTAEIRVIVSLPNGTMHPRANAPAAHLHMTLPRGSTLWHCPGHACASPTGRPIRGEWNQPLSFSTVYDSSGEAIANFFVKASNFGVSSNGVTAAAAMPAVFYEGQGQAVLLTGYKIRSPARYDWSSPAAQESSGYAIWAEPLAKGYTTGLSVTGVNHGAQSHEDFMTFLAGALVALGGGALLAAIIEAVHRRDWDTLRALRPEERPPPEETASAVRPAADART
jgi:hypothetical protein